MAMISFSHLGNTKRIIGVELDQGSARAVVLKKNVRTTAVVTEEFVKVDYADEPMQATLRRLLRQLKTNCRRCAVSLWSEHAALRLIDGHPSDLNRHSLEARNATRQRKHDLVVDCHRMERLRDQGGPVLLECSVPRKVVDEITGVFRSAKYHVDLLQLTPIALYNSFVASQQDVIGRDPYFVVDIGWFQTTILGGGCVSGEQRSSEIPSEETAEVDPYSFRVAEEESPAETGPREAAAEIAPLRLIRVVPFGWAHVQELLIRGHGLSLDGELDAMQEDELIKAFVRSAVTPIREELEKSLVHLMDREGVGRPMKVYASGTMHVEALSWRILAEDLGIPLTHWNALRCTVATSRALKKYNLLSNVPLLPAASGVALQSLL